MLYEVITIDDKTLGAEIVMGDQIHIYADKLKVEDTDKNDGIDFQKITMADPIELDGEKVYESSPAVRIALVKTKELSGNKKVKIKLSYQGCSSAGLCYEPIESVLEFSVNTDKLPMSQLSSPSIIKAPAATAPVLDVIEKNATTAPRITSYNVCYTKLLRLSV